MREEKMNREFFETYIGKKVFISLKSGIHYEGKINGVDDGWLCLIDKFKHSVVINYSEIGSIEEKEGEDDKQE